MPTLFNPSRRRLVMQPRPYSQSRAICVTSKDERIVMYLLIKGNTPQLVQPLSKFRTVGDNPAITNFQTGKHASQPIAVARCWFTNCHADLSPSNPVNRNQQSSCTTIVTRPSQPYPVSGTRVNCLQCWHQKCSYSRFPIATPGELIRWMSLNIFYI